MVMIYKLKFTRLQQEILRFLFVKSRKSFNARGLARGLGVSSTAVLKALKYLKKEKLVKIEKDKESGRLLIELNKESERVFYMKRIFNLSSVYESGLVSFLHDTFPGAVIILFGSYSNAEDTINSDIDIAVIGVKMQETNLNKFEKILERKIQINYFKDFNINKNLKENILRGIYI